MGVIEKGCSQIIFLLWPKIAAVGEILWSPVPQPNDDDDDDKSLNIPLNIVTVLIAILVLDWLLYCLALLFHKL